MWKKEEKNNLRKKIFLTEHPPLPKKRRCPGLVKLKCKTLRLLSPMSQPGFIVQRHHE